MYDHQWRKRRRLWLLQHPLCRFCEERGRVTQATVVDHIIPHRGDPELFRDETNWQSLCKTCHDSAKQAEERNGYNSATGLDGWPLDIHHPVNARELEEKLSKTGSKLGKKQGGVVKK